MVVVGLTVGLRPGELTGLLWADIDLDAKPPTIAVSGAMKRGPDGRVKRGQVKRSKDGRRTIALPPTAVEALKAHRKRQLEERLAAGSEWKEGGLVFAVASRGPLDPSRVRRTWTRSWRARTSTLRGRSVHASSYPQAINSARSVKVLVRRVGAEGIEPSTSCASCMRSNRLSYAPWVRP